MVSLDIFPQRALLTLTYFPPNHQHSFKKINKHHKPESVLPILQIFNP